MPVSSTTIAVRTPRTTLSTRNDFAWVAALGIGFWFLVGFPFGNHNESYQWLARFAQVDSWRIWTSTVVAATFRPFGQGLAYLSWQLWGDSSWPVQLLNFALAAAALSATAAVLVEVRTFAVAMALAGAAYFAGYIYLFHVHGIFYSPVLGLVPALLYAERAQGQSARRAQLWIFAYAGGVGLLFHPYALILYFAYLVGHALERWKESPRPERLKWAVQGALVLLMLATSRPAGHRVGTYDNVRAFITSYTTTEISPALTAFSVVLLVATLMSIAGLSSARRLALSIVAVLASGVFVAVHLPVILLWIATAIFKLAHLGKWSLATTAASATLLPGIAPSGSPTYAIFAIVLSVIALACGWTTVEHKFGQVDRRWPVGILFVTGLLAIALRADVQIPVVSRLAQPLLAEREKTEQLESIINWILSSEYRGSRLVLERAVNPVDAGKDAIDRRRRPPTYQQYLDEYLGSRTNMDRGSATLTVTFGGHQRPGMVLLRSVPGRFAGTALVYRD
jgi:hypothetical protein